MKRILSFALIAISVCLVSCGSGSEHKGKAANADSIAAQQHADSLDMAVKKQHMDDSVKAIQTKTDSTKPATNDKK